MRVAVIDYGAGNLRSVLSALRVAGAEPIVHESGSDPGSVDAMVLPGVGAAADTMENLRRRGLADAVMAWIDSGRPFMGICIGLQVLFDDSTEGDGQKCLGILPGHVVRLPPSEKVPHMGWNQVVFDSANPLFSGIPSHANFYFVHSYVAVPGDAGIVAGETEYGTTFCSVVQRGALVATQFHPEKSGPAGLRFYQNFLSGVTR